MGLLWNWHTGGAMKRACRGISSLIRGWIASINSGKKNHLGLTLIWSKSEAGFIVALISLLLCLLLIRSHFPWRCKVSELLQSPKVPAMRCRHTAKTLNNSTHLSIHLSPLISSGRCGLRLKTSPDIFLPRHFVLHLLGNLEGQMGYIGLSIQCVLGLLGVSTLL